MEPTFLSVFTGNMDNPAFLITGTCVEVLMACMFLGMIVAGFGLTDRVWGKWAVVVITLAAAASILIGIPAGITEIVVGNQQIAAHHAQVEHMNANLQQKYHMTLANPNDKGYSDDELASDNHAYNVSLADGKTATYYIKWDKGTGEPTVLDKGIPTPQELNQNANKR